ncbi:unnamed protein product [Closterium sp. NIES-64]|nr:unnamed protein product [Closterium sp. NIES-64]
MRAGHILVVTHSLVAPLDPRLASGQLASPTSPTIAPTEPSLAANQQTAWDVDVLSEMELKAQCERMEKEDRRITSIDLTHIPESDTEADNHGLHGSRRRRGKDADGVVMYGLGWQPSRDVERSNGPDHEVEIELLPQRSEPKEGGGGLKEGVKHARKSHRRQQSCPTDYCLVEQTERADRTQRERVERSPSSRPASRHRRCSSGVLQPTYSLSDQQPLNALTAQQPSCTPTGFGYDCGEGERIAGTQSSRGRTSPGVQQEARVLNPLGSRLNPHFKPCQPGPPPQQGASDDPAASASLSESPHRLQPPPHEEQPPCQPCLAPPGQGWPGQGPFGEGAFEQVSFRFKAPPGNAPERWQQVMEERVREAFAMGYLAGLRDAAAHSVAPPAAALAAVAAAGASPGRFVPKKISSDSHYVTSQWRERAAPPRMCKSSTVSGISHCQDRSPLRWTREVRMPLESIHQSSTVSGGGSHSNGGSPLGWTGEGEVQMPQGSHARLKGPLQARMEGQAAEQTTTASAASSAAAAAASCPAAAAAAAAAASCPAAAAARDVMGVCSDVESDADSCQSPGGGGNVGGVHTGASCTGLRLSRRLFSGRLLLTRDSS